MGTGLLVTELIGQGVNYATGDFSKGASGFWVENGRIAYPVEGITVAGNLKDIFMSFEAMSDDVDLNGCYLNGSVLIREMTVAGNSLVCKKPILLISLQKSKIFLSNYYN